MSHRFLGKSLLVNTGEKKILVISDLHLGYDEGLRRTGSFMITDLFEETKEELLRILKETGSFDETVILGDLKHIFGRILNSEWKDIARLSDLLRNYCKKIVLVKGNHDAVVAPVARQNRLEVCRYYISGSYAFVHGDNDFDVLYTSDVRTWVIGHAHPAISLYEGAKQERYKCFLEGTYKKKEIIVVPSWFSVSQGIDVRIDDLRLAWPVDVAQMRVYIVGEGIDVLDFGILKNIS